MLQLSDVFEQLSVGELSTHNLAEGGVDPSNYPTLIAHTNAALLQIYKRFPLRLKETYVQEYEQISKY